MDTLTMLFLLFVAGCLYTFAQFLKMRGELRDLRLYVTELETSQNTSESLPEANSTPLGFISDIALPRAGVALQSPPTDLGLTLRAMQAKPPAAYRFPLGWYRSIDGAELQTAKFVGDVNHILLTGQSDSGKDNAALNILLSLALTHTPKQIQFAIIDGKGLDWSGWKQKQHTWLLATKPEQISDAMKQLTEERNHRYNILERANVTKWDNYKGNDLPLLVVFISELLLLENAAGAKNLTSWLNAELVAARAFGVRYVIATQNASNFSTQWRSQISLFIAGFQPSDSSDMPNTGLYTKELTERGLIAPSDLPSPSAGAGGVFTLIQGGEGIMVRTSLLSDQHRDYWLNQLPDKPKFPNIQSHSVQTKTDRSSDPILEELLGLNSLIPDDYILESLDDTEEYYSGLQSHKSTFESTSNNKSTSEVSRSQRGFDQNTIVLPFEDTIIPFDEQRRIIEAASNAKGRRQLCITLYGTDGGKKSTWVKLVCDALGLLQQPSAGVGK